MPRGKLGLRVGRSSRRGEKRGAVEEQGLSPGSGGSRLLGVLDALLLLADDLGDGAGDAAYQGPVLLEADAPIFVLIQVTDELVSRSTVPGVLGERAELLTPRRRGKRGGGDPMQARGAGPLAPRVPASPSACG